MVVIIQGDNSPKKTADFWHNYSIVMLANRIQNQKTRSRHSKKTARHCKQVKSSFKFCKPVFVKS